MRNPHLKLKEIIWEITRECKNGCAYCGSSEGWNQKTDSVIIHRILSQICKYPPQQIDISGGDPLLVSLDDHETIVHELKEAGVEAVKILINPKSLKNNKIPVTTIKKILGLYDWIGISINEESDVNMLPDWLLNINQVTYITNFNLQNIFLYNFFESFVSMCGKMWMVQYTIYKDQQNPLAIYNNIQAKNHFFSLISSSLDKKVKIILSDNLNNSECGAGLSSLGILANGNIVPCLSMRAWQAYVDAEIIGSILADEEGWEDQEEEFKELQENPLKFIWENRFQKQRFSEFKCCKDHCNNCLFQKPEIKIETNRIDDVDLPVIWPTPKPDLPWDPEPVISVYAVFPEPKTIMYGVPRGSTFVYGVPKSDTTTTGEKFNIKTWIKNINKDSSIDDTTKC